ncbi:membrane protein insertase YidC [Allosaccharopolyspora coralli]|uniref:Membrane protein insertase YidC n=1 Tax=Allosaccharopolyspora coralli TaxID=2665642 RepID=A0A5Q3QDC3_9PSEU|nr:membrane protein insertase YidC [Allosaccharopolyspora coralli]QGK71910.1 membrane protein insertase YidC [Allosaccharopolyspora coralli]
MLDFINYPVSAILWVWHQVFGFVLDPTSGIAWALSVVFLVITLRALLFKPFVHQVRSMKKMQEFAPQIQELKDKHGDDQQKFAQEMQKLQAEQGFNPLSGCLPILVQIPVFIGLFQVLNGFRPGAEQNFVFDAAGVSSFVEADLFGATLSTAMSRPAEVLASFGTDRPSMFAVGVPLMIAAAIATHFTARHSIQRQTASASTPQAAMMNKLMLWAFPAFALVGGPFLPLAILIYWLANNLWTLGQQRIVYNKIDREEAAAKAAEPQAPAALDSAASGSHAAPEIEVATAPATEAVASTSGREAATEQPGQVPGITEDRSRDTDDPGTAR